mmetsp:Transcript_6846/g.19368  ORF Transcript_6846/g.19368 Transcript_6846/m.19368 type:complete len:221 (-) Transcript_6846:268-930(-)
MQTASTAPSLPFFPSSSVTLSPAAALAPAAAAAVAASAAAATAAAAGASASRWPEGRGGRSSSWRSRTFSASTPCSRNTSASSSATRCFRSSRSWRCLARYRRWARQFCCCWRSAFSTSSRSETDGPALAMAAFMACTAAACAAAAWAAAVRAAADGLDRLDTPSLLTARGLRLPGAEALGAATWGKATLRVMGACPGCPARACWACCASSPWTEFRACR